MNPESGGFWRALHERRFEKLASREHWTLGIEHSAVKMRRATAPGAPRSAVSTTDRHDEQEQRIRALEAAFAMEQQRRDELEKKYARLKRRYVRLEVAHTLLQGAHEATRRERVDGTPQSSPPHGRNSSPSPFVDTQSPGSDVIDLTSPVGSRRVSLASPRRSPRLAGMRNSQQSLSSDDFCAESPASPNDREAIQSLRSASSGRRSTRSSSPYGSLASPRSPSPPRVSGTRRRQLEFYMPDPSSRPRPRPGSSASSPDEATIRSSSRRRTQSPESSPVLAERNEASLSPATRTPNEAAAASPSEDDAEDTSEAASIALAQYLQQQENMAAMREYEEHLRDLEVQQELNRLRQAAMSPPRGDHVHHHGGAVDPDNMTYEELLQLGEENGDVKKERWRQVAVQVLSSLPTHRWTTKSSDDISCIICQYGFSIGDVALTLPCAHVFHEECVTGWVRENNSCPLCKLQIADI